MSLQTVRFWVDGQPVAQPRTRAFVRQQKAGAMGKATAGVYDPGTADNWKRSIAIACKQVWDKKQMDGPVYIEIDFYFKRPKSHFTSNGLLKPSAPTAPIGKPDKDNLEKAVMDALTRVGLWKDDSQVVGSAVWKRYAMLDQPCGADIRVACGDTRDLVKLRDWP